MSARKQDVGNDDTGSTARMKTGTSAEVAAQTAGPDTDIGIAPEARTKIIAGLQQLLSDEVLLYLKTRNFHWNVEGPDFYELHKFFEAQYEQLDEVMDDVAERIRSIGGYAAGSMREFTQHATLTEVAGGARTELRMEALLLQDHERLIRRMRTFIDECGDLQDVGTQDFVTGVMEQHEKMAWMLRAFARRPSGGAPAV